MKQRQAAARPPLKLEVLPDVITLPEIVKIYRVSESTVRRELQRGTFAPRPFRKRPYRWRKADIDVDLKRQQAKATLPAPAPRAAAR